MLTSSSSLASRSVSLPPLSPLCAPWNHPHLSHLCGLSTLGFCRVALRPTSLFFRPLSLLLFFCLPVRTTDTRHGRKPTAAPDLSLCGECLRATSQQQQQQQQQQDDKKKKKKTDASSLSSLSLRFGLRAVHRDAKEGHDDPRGWNRKGDLRVGDGDLCGCKGTRRMGGRQPFDAKCPSRPAPSLAGGHRLDQPKRIRSQGSPRDAHRKGSSLPQPHAQKGWRRKQEQEREHNKKKRRMKESDGERCET